jgi:hypothetical protein
MTKIEEFKSKYIKLMIWTPEKLEKFAHYMLTRPLYLSDECRTIETITSMIQTYPPSLFFEIGDFQGILAFRYIYPEFKAGFLWKLWDKSIFSHNLVKDVRKLIDLVMNEYKLKRLELTTADEKWHKGLRLGGFKLEGTHPNAFLWDGKLYTVFSYAIVKTDEH